MEYKNRIIEIDQLKKEIDGYRPLNAYHAQRVKLDSAAPGA